MPGGCDGNKGARELRSALTFCFRPEHELKSNLMVSADCEPTLASRIRCSSESSAMDCHDSKLNGTVFGIYDWLTYLQDQATRYRKLVERADDPFIKTELLVLRRSRREQIRNRWCNSPATHAVIMQPSRFSGNGLVERAASSFGVSWSPKQGSA